MSRPPAAIASAEGCASARPGGAAEPAGQADAAGRSGLLRERARGGVALQDGDRVGVLGGRDTASRRRARSRARRRRRAHAGGAHAGVVAAADAGLVSAELQQRAAGRVDRERGDRVGVASGDVQAAAVGGDRERGRAEQADAGGAAAEATGPHAAGRALELHQRAGVDVARERGHRVGDGRGRIQVATAGRERDLRDAAQPERVTAAAGRRGDTAERTGRLGQLTRLRVALGTS